MKIFEEIKKDKNSTRESLIISTELSDRTVSRGIKSLQEKGFIRREGSKKTGYWEIIG